MGQLKQSLIEGTSAHMETNNQMMQQNMSLIDEINKQRDNNRSLKQHVQAEMGKLRHLYQSINIAQRSTANKKSRAKEAVEALKDITGKERKPEEEEAAELTDQLYRNRQRILALRAAIAELEGRRLNQRSFSREMLPPIEGVTFSGDGGNNGVDERQQLSLQGQGV
jgi:hypothetical protein